MKQGLVNDLVSVFAQIDRMRGMTPTPEPLTACQTCGGRGKLKSDPDCRQRIIRNVPCPKCGGTGWKRE